MHLIEVIIVTGLIFIALFFVKNMEVTTYSIVEKENRLQAIGLDALENLANRPDKYEKYDNLLISYIMLDKQIDEYSYLETELSNILPEGTLFRITVYSISDFVHNSSLELDDVIFLEKGTDIWIEEETCVSRILVIDNKVYSVVLGLWFNAGG